jgi:hypothetical protein
MIVWRGTLAWHMGQLRSAERHVVSDWLIYCADPLGPVRERRPATPIPLAHADHLVDQASAHGVICALLRHFPPFTEDPAFEPVKEKVRSRHRDGLGWNMVLRSHGDAVMAEASELPVTVVKGPVFARKIYPEPAFRCYGDIDLLAAPQAVSRLGAILTKHGFELVNSSPETDPQEWSWLHRENDKLLIEVQTDLVHAPSLRRAFSLTYDMIADEPQGPAALLLVALLHGALGQHYSKLQHIVDICQAVRALDGDSERRRFEILVERANARFVCVTGLEIVGRMLAEPRCVELARTLGSVRYGRLAHLLIDRSVVMSTQDGSRWLHSWRRQVFRWLSKRNLRQLQ